MKEIKSIKLVEESLFETEQNVSKSARRLPPSGSGSGHSTLEVEGEGDVHLTPTNYSYGDYSWDFEGGASWKASANLVFSNGCWVLDTLSVSLKSGSASITVSGRSSESSGVEIVSDSGGVTIEPLSSMGADVSGEARVVVSGSKKDKGTGSTIDSYSKELNVSISFKIELSLDGRKLTSDLGRISVG